MFRNLEIQNFSLAQIHYNFRLPDERLRETQICRLLALQLFAFFSQANTAIASDLIFRHSGAHLRISPHSPQFMSQTHLSSLRGYEFSPLSPSKVSEQLPGFEVDGILGVGGMGAVYRGWQNSLHRHVAIKLLPEELETVDGLAEQFESEARAMARLSHGSIAGVFDINRTEKGHSYFVMEYIDGGTLHDLMQDRKLKTEEIVHIMTQVCDGLQYAHDRGVIHRDIKPNNILITLEGKVKLVDFGLAHVGEAVSPGSMAGTPRYMAPELFEDDVKVDGRADLYAMGVVLYELLTGGPPKGEFKPPSHVASDAHPDFDSIVTRAMQRRPVNRQESAAAMREQLEKVGEKQPEEPVLQGAGPKALNMGPLHTDPREDDRQAPPTPARSRPSQPSRPPKPTYQTSSSMMGIPDWWPVVLIGMFIVAGLIALGIWLIER